MLWTLARCRALAPGMHPHFALCFDARLARELRNTGCEPTMLGAVHVSRPWTVAAARNRLRRLLDRERFDVAICHSYWPHGMFSPVVRSRRLPLVYWSHDVPTGRGWLERWARRTPPDLVLANSRFTAGAVRCAQGARGAGRGAEPFARSLRLAMLDRRGAAAA